MLRVQAQIKNPELEAKLAKMKAQIEKEVKFPISWGLFWNRVIIDWVSDREAKEEESMPE